MQDAKKGPGAPSANHKTALNAELKASHHFQYDIMGRYRQYWNFGIGMLGKALKSVDVCVILGLLIEIVCVCG